MQQQSMDGAVPIFGRSRRKARKMILGTGRRPGKDGITPFGRWISR
jgi:hypothetical protein